MNYFYRKLRLWVGMNNTDDLLFLGETSGLGSWLYPLIVEFPLSRGRSRS